MTELESVLSTRFMQVITPLQHLDQRQMLKLLLEEGRQLPSVIGYRIYHTSDTKRVWGKINTLRKAGYIKVDYDGIKVTGVRLSDKGREFLFVLISAERLL